MGEYGDYEQGFTFFCPETGVFLKSTPYQLDGFREADTCMCLGDRVHIFPRELWHDPNVPLSMRFRHKTTIPTPAPDTSGPPYAVHPIREIAEKYQAPILLFNHLYAKDMAERNALKGTTGSLASGSVPCKTVTSVPSSGNSSSAASVSELRVLPSTADTTLT